MIDTVAITFKNDQYTITDKKIFEKAETVFNMGTAKHVINPTKEEKMKGRYYPRITFQKRPFLDCSMKVEFSAPKLLYGNNLNELCNDDFEAIVNILRLRLKERGIWVFDEVIRNAKVSIVNFSKNIFFTDFTTSSMAINLLAKIDTYRHYDILQRDYQDGGKTLYHHTNSCELVFYDKKADFKKAMISEKRSKEKDYYCQLDLFKKPFEVLRVELRFSKLQKLKSLFKKLKIESNFTFREIFDESLAKRLLNEYWDNLTERSRLIAFQNISFQDIFEKIVSSNPNFSASKALSLTGFVFASNESNLRRVKDIVCSKFGYKQWQRINSDAKELKLPDSANYEIFKEISKQLDSFIPFRTDLNEVEI